MDAPFTDLRRLRGVRGVLLAALLSVGLHGVPAAAEPAADAPEATSSGSAEVPAAEEAGRAELDTGAVELLEVQRRAAADRAEIRKLEAQIREVEREFEAASEAFEEIDAERSALRRAGEEPEAAGARADPAALRERIDAVEGAWREARDALDLAIRRRQALEQQAAEAGVDDRRVATARRELEERQEVFARLAEAARLVDSAIDLNQEDLAASRELLAIATAERDRSEASRRTLLEETEALRASGAPSPEIGSLRRRAEAAKRRSAEAATEVEHLTARIDMLTPVLERLRARRVALDEELAEAEARVTSAEKRLAFLQSPWAPHRTSSAG